MEKALTDSEKQQLLATFYIHKIYAPGLDVLSHRIAESIVEPKARESAAVQLTYYLAAYGNFELAEKIARERPSEYARACGLAVVGREQARRDPAAAERYLLDAAALLQRVVDSDEKAIVLQELVRGYVALKQMQKATELASRIYPVGGRVDSLCEVATELWAAGETSEAERVVEDARKVADGAEPADRTIALNEIAKILVRMDRKAEAVEFWEEALKFVDESLDPPKLRLVICKSLASIGERERARRVAESITNDARRVQALAVIEEQ